MFFRKKNLRTDLLRQGKRAHVPIKFNFVTIISTWFYIGKSPIAPGTVASLSTYLIYQLALQSSISLLEVQQTLLFVALILLPLGWWCVHKFQDETKTSDNKMVVIDEIVGQLLTFGIAYKWLYAFSINYAYRIGMTGQSLAFWIGFLLFRYFDIFKPLFIGYADRLVKGALGVMLDDILAAVYAGLILQGMAYFISR